MRRASGSWALVVASLVLLRCTAAEESEGFSEAEWNLIHELLLPDLPSSADASGDELALLGQQLFFDRGLSSLDGGTVACKDCHDPRSYFSDPRADRATSLGVSWTKRNSPTVLNVGSYRVWGLDGRGDTLENQSIIAYKADATMRGDELTLGRALLARYQTRYEALFGPLPVAQLVADAGVDAGTSTELEAVMRNAAQAWAAYLRRLQTGPAPFDRWAGGETSALAPAGKRGLKLFLGQAGCIECHHGPLFSDNRFYNLGLAQVGPHVPNVDEGRFGVVKTNEAALLGAFRTRSLRNVSETGPYFHAGQYEHLRDVIWFYSRGGDHSGVGTPSRFLVPLGLTEDQASDLEAFLRSLTGPLPDAGLLCDASRLPDLAVQCAGGPR